MNKSKGIVFMGISFELVAMCVGGFYVGQFIDDYYHWKNLAQTYLVLALLVSWFVHLFYLLRRFEAEGDDGENQPKP